MAIHAVFVHEMLIMPQKIGNILGQLSGGYTFHDNRTLIDNLEYSLILKVLLAEWKVKTPCNANGVFINKCSI